MSPQLKAALTRATPEAIAVALLAGLGVWQTTRSVEGAVLAFVVPLLTVVAGRGVVEGVYDAKRNTEGRVTEADVTPNLAPGPPTMPSAVSHTARG